MVSELRGHRQPIAKFRALTLARFYFFSHLHARARSAPPALADGRTMVAAADDGERATGSSPTDRQIPRTDTGRVFIFSLTYTRARGARRPLWLMAERWSPPPTMVSELRGHRQPIAKFRALTLARFYFFSHLHARARSAPPALADGRTMVAAADDGERATGSSPTDRQIPRTDTGRFYFFSHLHARARSAPPALADGRTMVAAADDGERATGSSPTDRQIPRTDTGRLSSRALRL